MNRIQVPQVMEPVESDSDNRRQWPRYSLPARESFTFTVTADGHSGACTIEDISLGGARLRVTRDIPQNLEIRIEHPLVGHAQGRCCWQARNRLGVAFDHSEHSLAFIAHCLAEGVPAGLAEPAA